jgi:hypothetical protein
LIIVIEYKYMKAALYLIPTFWSLVVANYCLTDMFPEINMLSTVWRPASLSWVIKVPIVHNPFFVISDLVTYTDCISKCPAEYPTTRSIFAKINSAAEQTQAAAAVLYLVPIIGGSWIGLSRSTPSGDWKWQDGQVALEADDTTIPSGSFGNWGAGYPTSIWNFALITNSNGVWGVTDTPNHLFPCLCYNQDCTNTAIVTLDTANPLTTLSGDTLTISTVTTTVALTQNPPTIVVKQTGTATNPVRSTPLTVPNW